MKKEKENAVKRAAPAKRPKVLVVEDSATQAVALKHVLEQHDLRVFAARDGQEALAMTGEIMPDVVVSDIIMPGMDGYELCERIKGNVRLMQIPVILLTALSDPKDVIRGLEAGADNFIIKPFDEEYLVSQIHYLLEDSNRKVDKGASGATVVFAGREYPIRSAPSQILNTLVSIYESAVNNNRELVKAQRELIRLNEQLEQHLHMLEQAQILVRDIEGRIIFWNKGAERMYGYTKEEAIGKISQELLHTVFPKPLAEIEQEAWQNGKWEGDLTHTTRDGAKVVVLSYWTPSRDANGRPAAIIESNTDITERKKAEQLKDEFIGMVSHELKTPLTVIMGALATAADLRITEEQARDLLHDAVMHTEILGNIVDNLLELSRRQSDRLTLQRQSVNVDEIASSVIDRLRSKSAIHRVTADFAPALPAVQADALRVERIIYNLVDNAIKYSPKGGEVGISVRRDGDYLVVGVSDQGPGICREDQPRLFQSFERLGAKLNRSIQGTGLGLRVCRILAEAHGGRIWVESEAGKGATFLFTLPISHP